MIIFKYILIYEMDLIFLTIDRVIKLKKKGGGKLQWKQRIVAKDFWVFLCGVITCSFLSF